jgi:hypothetical protein
MEPLQICQYFQGFIGRSRKSLSESATWKSAQKIGKPMKSAQNKENSAVAKSCLQLYPQIPWTGFLLRGSG